MTKNFKSLAAFVALIILLSGCKTNSFKNQRYTHFKHHKSSQAPLIVETPEKAAVAKNTASRVTEPKTILLNPVLTPVITTEKNPVVTAQVTKKEEAQGVSITSQPQKVFKSIKKIANENKARGPLAWLINTVFGIIILILFVALIALIIIYVL